MIRLSLKDLLTKPFKIKGAIIYVLGRMGFGKTDFALAWAQLLLKWDIIDLVITNIKLFEEYDTFKYFDRTSKLDQLLEIRCRKLVIIDEAGIAIDSRRSTSKVNDFCGQ